MNIVCVGTYEGGLIGLTLEENNQSLKTIFAFSAHTRKIKTLVASGNLLISATEDEISTLYDLDRLKEMGSLPRGFEGKYITSGNCFRADTFTEGGKNKVSEALRGENGQILKNSRKDPTHCLLGFSDGTIELLKVKNWNTLRLFKRAHKTDNSTGQNPRQISSSSFNKKAPIIGTTQLATHKKGLLFLSTGQDLTLKLWDLSKGVCAFSTLLSQPPLAICWTADETVFVSLFQNKIRVTVALDGSSKEQQIEQGNNTAMIVMGDKIVVGNDEGNIFLFKLNFQDANSISVRPITFKPHKIRVKGLAPLKKGYFVSVDSDGWVQPWLVREDSCTPLKGCSLPCRVTCVASNYDPLYEEWETGANVVSLLEVGDSKRSGDLAGESNKEEKTYHPARPTKRGISTKKDGKKMAGRKKAGRKK